MKILITGATGLLGPYLVDAASSRGRVTTTSARSGDVACDCTDPIAVERLMRSVEPDVVVHAAAMTDVDACEQIPDRAERTNHLGVANTVSTLSAATRYVYVSTDQVYPDTPGPHREGDEAPVNVYGRTKLMGERAALMHDGSLVLRTNLFGPSQSTGRKSLSDFFIDSFRERRAVNLFDDLLFSPLHMKTLAELTFDMVEAGASGVFNLGCREGMSKADFALSLARQLGLSADCATIGPSSRMSGRATRAKDLRLDVSRAESILGSPMPTLLQEIGKLQ